MKLKMILAAALAGCFALGAEASPKEVVKSAAITKEEMQIQRPATSASAHREAHRRQLANAGKPRLDHTVVSDFILEDVRKREQKPAMSAETSTLIDDLLSEARTHIGKRYRHGAKGPSAFDCSGFSSYVYRQFGYSISLSSRSQFLQGTPVDRKDLRKGDLVFFTSRSSGGAVGHVGIVTSADNEKGTFKFIHASIRGVKISDFEGYYVGRYIGAKRIIND